MKKTKLEEYLIANSLCCEIVIKDSVPSCSIFKQDQLYLRFHDGKNLNDAIEKAVNKHREESVNDKDSE